MVTVRGSGVSLGAIPEVQKAGTRSAIVCHIKWNNMPSSQHEMVELRNTLGFWDWKRVVCSPGLSTQTLVKRQEPSLFGEAHYLS